MKKWNCLIIDGTLDIKKGEDILKTPDEISVEITDWNNFQNYNFEDYDFFFINFHYFYRFPYTSPNSFNKERIRALATLISGDLNQIKFIFASKISAVILKKIKKNKKIPDLISHLWEDIPLSINKEGTKILITNPDYTLSKLLFSEDSQPSRWKWSIKSEELPDNSFILAKNKIGNVISLIFQKKNNYLIFLPHPTSKKEFLEKCLANLDEFELELYQHGLDFLIEKPRWLDNFDPFNKIGLIGELNKIQDRIKRIESYEILLYGSGKRLERSIYKIFSYLGFQNIKRTVDRPDLLCETESVKIIAEIKGLKKAARERNLTQMYKWHVEELNKENLNLKKIKQVFICNAYIDKNPEERGDFFDKKVIEVSEYQNWGLLSTLELYNGLLKIWNGELKKEDVKSKIENLTGRILF